MGAVKNIGITPHEALYNISYANIMLFCSVIPTMSGESKEQSGFDDALDANNPNNFLEDSDIDETEE